MLESATGSAHCIALAMLDNFTYPADIFPSQRFYDEDMSDPPVELDSNPELPSVSAFTELPEPVPERLARCQVQHVDAFHLASSGCHSDGLPRSPGTGVSVNKKKTRPRIKKRWRLSRSRNVPSPGTPDPEILSHCAHPEGPENQPVPRPPHQG